MKERNAETKKRKLLRYSEEDTGCLPVYESPAVIERSLRELSLEEFGLDEWVQATACIAGVNSTFASQSQAQQYLLEYSGCKTCSVRGAI